MLSKDVIVVEVDLSLIPPRTQSTNDTTMLCHFGAGSRGLAFIPSHQPVTDEGSLGGAGGARVG